MIIVRIHSGLGNQMFQYAAGKRLAIAHGVKMKLDISSYEKSGFRSYGLGAFHVPEEQASRAEIRNLKCNGKQWWRLLTKRARREARKSSPYVVTQNVAHFDPGILNLDDEIYCADTGSLRNISKILRTGSWICLL